jgi:glutaredoxin
VLLIGGAAVLFMGAAAAYRLRSLEAPSQGPAATAQSKPPGPPAPAPSATTFSNGTETNKTAQSSGTETRKRGWPNEASGSSAPVASSPAGLEATPSAEEAAPQPAPDPLAATPAALHVVVYTTSWCPHCQEAKAWMASRGIAYEERDIEASTDNRRMMKQINSRGDIPTFDIDGEVLVGFSPGSLASLLQRAKARQVARRL